MYHTATYGDFCPVKALAHRVHLLYNVNPVNTKLPLSFITVRIHITSTHITQALGTGVILASLLNASYNPTWVSAHSLCASGPMALRLNDVGEDLIKKLGHWSSSTWLTYIHSQNLCRSFQTHDHSSCILQRW
jgi:hypothetical protein